MVGNDRQSVELDHAGLKLLDLLVRWLPKVRPDNPRTFIGYKQAHEELGLSQTAPTFGESLQQQGLNSLAEWTARRNLDRQFGS